jgi:integrase
VSVHRYRDKQWRVAWRDSTGTQRNRIFDRKGDADQHDTAIRRAKQIGPRALRELEQESMTLRAFITGPWRMHAATLSQASRDRNHWAIKNHLAEILDEPLLEIDAARVLAHQTYLREHGRTDSTTHSTLVVLSGILQVAVGQTKIGANPVRAIRKVGAGTPEVHPLTVEQLERLIDDLDGRDRALVVIAGHLGLRPGETRQVAWEAWDGDARLIVPSEIVKENARRTRSIEVPRMTAHHLRAWRLASGRPDASTPIVGPMSANAIRLWNRKNLRPATKRLFGREDVTLKTMRHTHASALHYAGWALPAAAARMGHSVAVHVKTYTHVLEGLDGRRYPDLDALITDAHERAQRAVS